MFANTIARQLEADGINSMSDAFVNAFHPTQEITLDRDGKAEMTDRT